MFSTNTFQHVYKIHFFTKCKLLADVITRMTHKEAENANTKEYIVYNSIHTMAMPSSFERDPQTTARLFDDRSQNGGYLKFRI